MKILVAGALSLMLTAAGCIQITRVVNTNQQSVDESSIDRSKALEFSEGLAKAILEDRQHDLYLKMEKAFRDGVPEKDVKPILEQMYAAYGKPLEAEFKSDESGMKMYGNGENKPMRKFWYALRTSSKAKGTYFLFTEIVSDSGSLACSSFSIVSFSSGVPPSFQ
jgi:hypothetical protein